LLAAAAIQAKRSDWRHRVWQRSSGVDVLLLLAVASSYRLRHRISRAAVTSRRLLGAAAAIYFSRFRFCNRVFHLMYQNSKRADNCS
jgi:hypothetical protein